MDSENDGRIEGNGKVSKIQFEERAWEEFQYWQGQDKKTLKKINKLIDDICRRGNDGLGASRTAQRKSFRLVEPRN